MSAPVKAPHSAMTSAAFTLLLSVTTPFLLAGCGASETVNAAPTETPETTTSTGTTTDTGTGGEGGAGGAPAAPIRTVEQRSPFGNVAATDNLLWDGDFEWSSPFSDQYGWLSGPPYSYDFPPATIGAACRSGVKCVTLAKNKSIIGIGVSSRTDALAVTVFARPIKGSCADVDVSLLDIATSTKDVEIPPTTMTPDATGWCLYSATVPSYSKKVYLLVDNNTGDELVVDDAVVRPLPPGAPPPPPPPMGPPAAERLARHEEAREALLRLRGPHIPPPSPARRAFEEHLSK